MVSPEIIYVQAAPKQVVFSHIDACKETIKLRGKGGKWKELEGGQGMV